ncbi:MAG: sulfur carrier protein ThiS [Prevotella sp.]|nr:sulfur carrier protein ThiS [Prevotella sp.]
MNIIINSKSTETQAQTLQALAEELSLPKSGVAMAKNQQMIHREDWDQTALAENDNILIIKAACGG